MIGISILYENDFLMIINKPAGLPVQGGKGIKRSLDSILAENFSPRPLLVHRLDRESSGVMLIAKSPGAAHELSILIGSSKIKRKYIAICRGIPKPPNGTIRLDLESPGKRGIIKKSETSYKILKSINTDYLNVKEGYDSDLLKDFSCSLVELDLGTGRMHQIRRHLSAIGHPLLGDDKYGDFPLNKTLKKALGLKTLLLHSHQIQIPDISPLPGGLKLSSPNPPSFSIFPALME